MATRAKRKSKSIEIFARLTPTGISIPSAWNRNRLMLEAQRVPPDGVEIKVTIGFISKAKSAEMMGFYFGAVIPLWVAHKKDLLYEDELESDPLAIRELIRKKKITKQDVDDTHHDFMREFRPMVKKNWITGKEEIVGQSLADMTAYEAALAISEIYQYISENTGMNLNTVEYKKARDAVRYIIEKGPRAAKEVIEYPKEDIDPTKIPF